VRERNRREEVLNAVTHFLPEAVGDTAAAAADAALHRAFLAARGFDRLVHGGDDVGDGDAASVARQPIAAAWAAHAGHETSPAHACEKLFEVGERDFLPARH